MYFYSYELARVIRFIDTENRIVNARDCGKDRMGRYFFFKFYFLIYFGCAGSSLLRAFL